MSGGLGVSLVWRGASEYGESSTPSDNIVHSLLIVNSEIVQLSNCIFFPQIFHRLWRKQMGGLAYTHLL